MIPENRQKYVSTDHRSLLWCKTLLAHFSNIMLVDCLLNLVGYVVATPSEVLGILYL